MTATCPHGFSSRAQCIDCMEDGPVDPRFRRPAESELMEADWWTEAKFVSRCARNAAHILDPGDRIGLVEGLGWVCDGCAR